MNIKLQKNEGVTVNPGDVIVVNNKTFLVMAERSTSFITHLRLVDLATNTLYPQRWHNASAIIATLGMITRVISSDNLEIHETLSMSDWVPKLG